MVIGLSPRRILPVLLLGASALACNKTYPNPFTTPGASGLPGATDDVIFVTDSWGAMPTGLGEVYSASSSSGHMTRLTSCNTTAPCNTLEVAPAPDRKRLAVMRVRTDTNGDGRLEEADGAALVFVDLTRNVEADLVPATGRVVGTDWSPLDGLIVYSGVGPGGLEDLYRVDTNGQNAQDLTNTPTVRELRPRIDATGSVAVFERIDATSGKAGIWIFESSVAELQVDPGGPGTDPLPGTPYVVGADASPAFSPDGTSVVFRRLTGTGNGGLGTWDILTAKADGTGVTAIASGPVYRGAPDWGARGIVFAETDVAKGTSNLVVVQPDGSQRKTPVTLTSGFTLDYPRWLAAP